MPAIRKIIIVLAVLFFPSWAWAALSSSVVTGDCPAGQVTVFKMSATSNAHAGLSSSLYPVSVCASGVSGLSNSCSGTFVTVVKLSGATNAHARQGDQADYPSATNTCLSVPSGGSVSVGYRAGDCSGFDATLASMSQFPTNAHVGGADAYPNKICASANEPPGGVILIPSSNNSPPAPITPPTPEEEEKEEEKLQPPPPPPLFEEEEKEEKREEKILVEIESTAPLLNQNQNTFITPTAAVEIPQVRPVGEVSSKRGLLATAFAALDFPPKDFLDWSVWTVILMLGILALRGLFYLIIRK